MNRKQILDAIKEAEEDLKKGGPNTTNMALNRLEVLKILLWRWDNTNFYDEESDFEAACDNIVDELIELEEERIRQLKKLKED